MCVFCFTFSTARFWPAGMRPFAGAGAQYGPELLSVLGERRLSAAVHCETTYATRRIVILVKMLLWTGPGLGKQTELAKNWTQIRSESPGRPQIRCAASLRTCFEAGQGSRT